MVVLSTCSRFELYACSGNPAAPDMVSAWFEQRGGREADPFISKRAGEEALLHLFRVAAGLESWILGESEILAQVKKAYHEAASTGRTGPEINRIFQSAIAAGKEVRTRTAIQNGIRSIGGAVALLAGRIFGPERSGQAVVFGAGEAAEAAIRHLAAKNFSRIAVANRTLGKAEELALRFSGRAVAFEAGLEMLAEADVAVFSTSCPSPFVEPSWLKLKLARRKKPLFLIDLGLPRNVNPECARLSGVYLYDLDDLRGVVAKSMERKEDSAKQAQVIVEGAAAKCLEQFAKARALRAREEVVS